MFIVPILRRVSRSLPLATICLLFCTATMLAQIPISSQDQAALHAALDAYDQGRTGEAEPALRDLVKKYPSSYQANEALGSLYTETDALSKALPYLEHACTLAPREALAHANLGAAYLKLKNIPASLRELKRAAALDPQNVQTQANLGQAFLLASQPTAAAQAFGVALLLEPGNETYAYNQALALYQANALQQAMQVLHSIPDNSMSGQAHALAADLEEKQGSYKEALLDYQSAARLDPSAANIYNVTLELMRHWSWSEAAQIAAYGSTHFPADARFTVAQGIALYADGKYSKAAALFSALLSHDPNNAMYADLLGRSCGAAADDLTVHCGDLEQFAEKHPGNARIATFAAARILQAPLDAQDTVRAERLLQQAIVADPQLADAYFQLGVLAQQRLEWQQSAIVLEKAIALRPAYAEAHYRLSRAYAHLGKREQAQQQITLQQQYAQQEKDALNTRLQEVVTFLLKPS